MRKRPTRSEALLWAQLRERKLACTFGGSILVRVRAETVERDVLAAVAPVRAALGCAERVTR